jgi:acyl-CoA synthetase (AMP-forming)/AMP-acid ligase II
LIAHPAVLECAVIGVPDDQGLTKTRAFVVLKDQASACSEIEEELKKFVKDAWRRTSIQGKSLSSTSCRKRRQGKFSVSDFGPWKGNSRWRLTGFFAASGSQRAPGKANRCALNISESAAPSSTSDHCFPA